MFRSIPVSLAVIVLLGASLAPDDAYARSSRGGGIHGGAGHFHGGGHRVAAIGAAAAAGAYYGSNYQQPPYQNQYPGRGECGN